MNKILQSVTLDYPLLFKGYFFNEPAFLQKQGENRRTFVLLNSQEQVSARFTLFIKENEAYSPLRAPFGSLEFENNLSLSELQKLIHAIDDFLINNRIKKIKIVSFPECYNFENARILKSLLNSNGYTSSFVDHNFHLEISERQFESSLHASEKRRLKKSQKAEFRFQVESEKDIYSVHEMISKCRNYKGYPLSMNFSDFEKMFKDFPGRYFIFTLRDKEKLVASAIGVKINEDIIYNFMPADNLEYRNYSPMVLLMKEVYDYCRSNNFKIFDLGTAAEQGIPNAGLIKFKKNLGGELSFKHTFEKIFLHE